MKRGNTVKYAVLVTVICLAAAAVTAAVLYMLFHFGVIKTGKDSGDKDDAADSSYYVEAPDADEYYESNSDILSETDAADSEYVHTESETYTNITGRGFGDFPITTNYSMSGEYSDDIEISPSSEEKHPMYSTFYVTSSGDLWTIFEINGKIMANPVFYNEQSGSGVQLIISETESVVSYNSDSNKFYETVPDSSVLRVRTVSRIDAETLESLTVGAIDEL